MYGFICIYSYNT